MGAPTWKSLVTLIKEEKWSTVLSRLLTKFGRWESRKVAKFGRLPLHVACHNPRVPRDVVRFLLEANPDAAKKRDEFGDLPLHWACERGTSGRVVKELLTSYPQGAQTPTFDGVLPIHYALQSSIDVVKMVVDHFPDGVRAKNEVGKLPLLHACETGAAAGVISVLVDSYPKAATVPDDKGFLPLHWCCAKNVRVEEVGKVLEAFPQAVQAKAMKSGGVLPLHVACDFGASNNVLELLLKAFPDAVTTYDEKGRLPIFWTCQKSSKKIPLSARLAVNSSSAVKRRGSDSSSSFTRRGSDSTSAVKRRGSGQMSKPASKGKQSVRIQQPAKVQGSTRTTSKTQFPHQLETMKEPRKHVIEQRLAERLYKMGVAPTRRRSEGEKGLTHQVISREESVSYSDVPILSLDDLHLIASSRSGRTRGPHQSYTKRDRFPPYTPDTARYNDCNYVTAR